jgi:tRNA 2-thiouridine synthesizing protein A
VKDNSEASTTTPDGFLDGTGNACVNLTPAIRSAIAAMSSGEILEIVADDPSAREGVPAWVRLTGHELINVVEIDSRNTRFFIKRK